MCEANPQTRFCVSLPRLNRAILFTAVVLLFVTAVAWHQVAGHHEPVYQGRSLSEWLKDLGHGDDQTADVAQTALRKMFHPQTVQWRQRVEFWFERTLRLQDRHGEKHRERQKDFADAIIPMLSSTNPGVRSGAARALETCGEESRRIVPALLEHLNDSEQRTRLWTARTLGHMLAEPRQVIPALIKALEDEDGNVRSYAALSLEHFGTNAVEALPALRRQIEKRGRSDAWSAAEALEKITAPTVTSSSR